MIHKGYRSEETDRARAALAAAESWTAENLDKWLTSPKAFADGTKMTFAGLPNPQDRADVVAYLNSQGGSLTLGGGDAAKASAAEPAKK